MLSIEEIREIIEKGETGRVEFKSDKEKNIDFAKEITAFANGPGGYLLVGAEDDGTVSGVSNPLKFEEKIYNICSDSIRPVITPELWKYKIEGKDIFCFYISPGFSKPYAILQRGRERYYTRRGTRIQEAGRDELLRLFQTSGQIHYEVTPIIKGRYADLDFARIVDFFRHNQINKIDISGWNGDKTERFLKNKEVLVEYQGNLCPTVAGALLFGKKPSHLLGYSGITVTKFADTERDYNYVDFRLDKPIMNTFFEHGEKEKSGLIDEALEKIKSIILEKSSVVLKGAVRVVDYPYPEESIREAVVNAVAHRDYTISGIDIRVDIYPDRFEIESPGKLPNTISIESIRLGAKYYRNQILVQYLKEAGFMDLHSLGIPVKILKLCTEYTGREPDLTESENSFKITFYPKKKTTVSKVEEEILKLLRTSAKPMKTREISVALGVSKRTIINWINRLIDRNMVEPTSENRNDPNCRYRLRY
ncbi:MAG: putative DNA binding domain-containing protein [Desulfobacteraceae bacterium]|nr:putative DNA binding domain-containing protein [Desulfobacteraceae bacterium]